MLIPTKAVANQFLDIAEGEGRFLTPMQLQKLVYFSHGWYLALADSPLVNERPEAWQFGPVFPSLYHTFKEYGAGNITGRAHGYESAFSEDGGFSFKTTTPSMRDITDRTLRENAVGVVQRVWEVYGKWTGVQLSKMTHVEGGPWHEIWSKNKDRKGTDIPDELIKAYFKDKIGKPGKSG